MKDNSFAGFVILAGVLAKYLPKMELFSGLILMPTSPGQGASAINITGPAEKEKTAVKTGDIGEVVTALRPAGRARFDNLIVDVVAEGEFLEKTTKVKIVEIHGNRVIVKKED